MSDQRRNSLRQHFQAPELLVMPGVHDAISAAVFERAGFRAVMAGGNAALGAMLAQPDLGQGNMRDMADHYARICNAVQIPVFVDADTGFGGVHNVTQAVRALEAAGVAGILLNDQVFPNRCGYLAGKEIVPADDMMAKLFAALDARTDETMLIGARTDILSLAGVETAVERCQLYLQTGVDFAKPQGADTLPEIRRFVAEIACPYVGTLSQAAGAAAVDLDQLQAAGAAAVSLPTLSLFAATRAVRDVARMLGQKSIATLEHHLISREDYYNLVRLDHYAEREQQALDRAAAIRPAVTATP